MNSKALVLAAATFGVAVVTLVALNLIAPITHAQEAQAEGVTADQVFSASIAEPGATSPAGDTAFQSEGQVEVAAVQDGGTATAPEAASSTPPVDAAAPADMSSPAPAGGDVAEAAGACPTGLTDPNAKPVVVVAGGAPGGPATPPPADPSMAPPAPADVAAVDPGLSAPAPEPAPEPAPAPAAEPPPAPAPEPAAAAPEPEPAPAPPPKPKPTPKPKAAAKPAAPKKPPPEANVAWWPAKQAGKLNLVYAGEASFTKAIVMMFDGQFDSADSANQNIKVTPKKGGEIKGKWMVANGNKSMLLLNVDPGLYTVEVGTGLTDKGGRAIGAASSGVVFVH